MVAVAQASNPSPRTRIVSLSWEVTWRDQRICGLRLTVAWLSKVDYHSSLRRYGYKWSTVVTVNNLRFTDLHYTALLEVLLTVCTWRSYPRSAARFWLLLHQLRYAYPQCLCLVTLFLNVIVFQLHERWVRTVLLWNMSCLPCFPPSLDHLFCNSACPAYQIQKGLLCLRHSEQTICREGTHCGSPAPHFRTTWCDHSL